MEIQDDDTASRYQRHPRTPSPPTPSGVSYTLGGFYQKAPRLMTSKASSWSPIPDNLSYIYDWGYLGMLSMITKDIRQPLFQQKFAGHLLGAQDGITALQREIFLNDFFALVGQSDRTRANVQQGVQARSAT